MKICPKCGKVLSYNSYFGGYICVDCNWEDASVGDNRNKGYIVTTEHRTRTFKFLHKYKSQLVTKSN